MSNNRAKLSQGRKKDGHRYLNAKDRAVNRRLRVLKLAKKLGNVSAACRQCGIDRASFYKYRRRYQSQGLAGLKNLSRRHHNHPQTTPPKIEEQILSLARCQPQWGCRRISNRLKCQNIAVSAPTVQGILAKNGLGIVRERLSRANGYDMK